MFLNMICYGDRFDRDSHKYDSLSTATSAVNRTRVKHVIDVWSITSVLKVLNHAWFVTLARHGPQKKKTMARYLSLSVIQSAQAVYE